MFVVDIDLIKRLRDTADGIVLEEGETEMVSLLRKAADRIVVLNTLHERESPVRVGAY